MEYGEAMADFLKVLRSAQIRWNMTYRFQDGRDECILEVNERLRDKSRVIVSQHADDALDCFIEAKRKLEDYIKIFKEEEVNVRSGRTDHTGSVDAVEGRHT